MSDNTLYCFSLSEIDTYLHNKCYVSGCPLDLQFLHCIKKIIILALDSLKISNQVALPESFQVDPLPQHFDDDLKFFLKNCLIENCNVEIDIDYSYEKTTISLR